MTYRMTVCPEPGCEKQHGVVYVPKFRGSRSAQDSVPSGGGDDPALTEVSDLQLVAAHCVPQPAPVVPPGGSAPRPAAPSRSEVVLSPRTGHHTRGPRAPYTGPRISPLRESARG